MIGNLSSGANQVAQQGGGGVVYIMKLSHIIK